MNKDQELIIITNVDELKNYLSSMPNNSYIYFTLIRVNKTDKNLYAIVDINGNGDDVMIKTQKEECNYSPFSKEDILEKLDEHITILGKECNFQVVIDKEMFSVLNIINYVEMIGSENRYIIELA